MILYLLPDFPVSMRKLLCNLFIETTFGEQNQDGVCACVSEEQKICNVTSEH